MKRYYVDFYDAFDGWGSFGFFPERLFESIEEARMVCNTLQENLSENNKKMGEHYGVIDSLTNHEVHCTARYK